MKRASAEPKRKLTSKRLRSALFFASDGKCALCGVELARGWHADHVEPWVLTRRTNVHEMQALCAACNLSKGARGMQNRSHQVKMDRIAAQVAAGTWPRKEVITDTTPGGGKTGQSIILGAELLRAGVVAQVFHFVPRKALQPQVCESWRTSSLWNPEGYKLHASENVTPLFPRDYAGVVASYDQLDANPGLYIHQAKRAPTLVVFDELQFLGDKKNRAWVQSARAIAEEARFVLGMSGTLFRHDGQELPFVRYECGDGSNERPDTNLRYPVADIRYTLHDAISEMAVKGADFTMRDGDVRWLAGDTEKEATLSEADDASQGGALYTFLTRQETWQALTDQWAEHWRAWRREVYPSRAIAIAADQEHARAVQKYLRERHRIEASLAISDEADAHDTLERFRRGSPEVLVTVAMASVGFDVTDCTHLLYLSLYRSLPYALQAFARVTRVDSKCNIAPAFQRAFIFVPNDPKMRNIVEWMRTEQVKGVRNRIDDSPTPPPPPPPPPPTATIPLSATPTAVSFANADEMIEGREADGVLALMARYPEFAAIPPMLLAKVGRAWSEQAGPAQAHQDAPKPLFRTRDEVGREVERLGRVLDFRSKNPPGTTNRQLAAMFGNKVRRTDKQLEECEAFIKSKLMELSRDEAQ